MDHRTIKQIIEYFPLPFCVLEEERIVYCNKEALKVFGYAKKEELLGSLPYHLSPYVQPDGQSSLEKGKEMIRHAKEKGWHQFLWTHRRKNGEDFLAEVTLYGEKNLLFATVRDIDLLEKLQRAKTEMEKDLVFLSTHDYLTGLYNKNFIIEQLKKLIQTAHRDKDGFALFFIDFDHFKKINDTLGHHTGDWVIKEVAQRLRKIVPPEALLARYGGDEFVILMDGLWEKDELYAIARGILESLAEPCKVNSNVFYISASIGIARYPLDGEDADTLIKNADIAMYKAKESKDMEYNIKFFDSEMEKEIKERFLLENHLHKALEKNELSLYFQPIVKIQENRIEAAEALIKWENEALGNISPDKFIPLAEETGLIHEIGEFVLNRVCQFIQGYRKKGAVPPSVAVNISVKQLENINFPQEVKKIIASYDIETRYLEFEITESVSAGKMEVIAENLQKIKEMGIRIAVDDFGTGYSSLAMLLNLKVDKIKIDKIFINKIGKSREEKIIRTIISMAKELGLNVVAEGIETEEQLEFLKQLNCEYGQGYFWSRPLKPADFEQYYSSTTG